MCVLCGEFIEQIHWTDMERKQLETIVAGAHQRERKRSRLMRAKICNDIFSTYGLKLTEWNNSKFILSTKTGKASVLHDLGQIWTEAEKFAGRPIDPLDPKLLESLK